MPTWFDAHLDLAYLAMIGRDMDALPEDCGTPEEPAAVTLPSLAEGNVRWALGTIYTSPDIEAGYPAGDVEAAHEAGRRQLDWYARLFGEGRAASMRDEPTLPVPDVDLAIGILIENADPVRTPDELPWWQKHGVVAVGMAWATDSRYAGGNRGDTGLTDVGHEFVRVADTLGIVLDLSHLNQRSTDELLSLTDRPVFASHSNCRSLLDGKNERHLTDPTIAEVGRRGGVVGLNLAQNFIRHDIPPEGLPTVDDAIRHIEHVCDVMGHRRGIGLGSDMDGGFHGNQMCRGIHRPAHLHRLTDALRSRGWPDSDLDAFAHANFRRFFREALG